MAKSIIYILWSWARSTKSHIYVYKTTPVFRFYCRWLWFDLKNESVNIRYIWYNRIQVPCHGIQLHGLLHHAIAIYATRCYMKCTPLWDSTLFIQVTDLLYTCQCMHCKMLQFSDSVLWNIHYAMFHLHHVNCHVALIPIYCGCMCVFHCMVKKDISV